MSNDPVAPEALEGAFMERLVREAEILTQQLSPDNLTPNVVSDGTYPRHTEDGF